MKTPSVKTVRCAIYTRVSTEHGLDQEFNSLDAQYEAAQAYIKSQAHAGWTLIRSRYDDGGYSGGSTDRPDLQKLLDDIRARKIDVIVVYKVDRLTRSLADFAKLVELFDAHGVSFVSVTQQFSPVLSPHLALLLDRPQPVGFVFVRIVGCRRRWVAYVSASLGSLSCRA
jgi:site-specific DNA recombinase